MLGKLIKHEFYATGRYFLPLYVFIIILTPLFSLSMRLMFRQPEEYIDTNPILGVSQGIFGAFSVGGFIFMMLAIFIATFVLIVIRFYRTTATSEAYLTFTLPVKSWEILFAKTLSAFVWEICSGIMAFFAVIAMVCIIGVTSPSEIIEESGEFIRYLSTLNINSAGTAILIIFSLIFGVFANISMIYLSIMLGQLFQKSRILISIAMYMAMNVAIQFVTSILTFPVLMLAGGISDNLESISDSSFINLTYLCACVENLILASVSLIITGYIMNKKLNVQ